MAVIVARCFLRVRWGVVLCVLGMTIIAAVNAEGSCGDIGTELESLRDVNLPDRPTQGSICGSSSCCGIGENKLRTTSRLEVEKFMKDSINQVVSLFETRSKRLEENFKEMMARSKKEFHSMFERTYGIIYLKNSDVFADFFAELEKYYSHGGFSLTDTMDHFFSILYQRMFKVINSQYDFSDEYLSCVAKDIAKLKPFGDIPIKLAILLRRSFVATRIFHKALGKGAQIAERMLKINVSENCGEIVTKMQYCDICTNQRGPGPCNSYCSDTLQKCLILFAQLNESWDNYIDGLDKVADKLLGAFNIEMVVEPINIKISEAIMNFQESGSEVSQKVFMECGTPVDKSLRRRRSAAPGSTSKEITYKTFDFNSNNNNGGNNGGKRKKHKKTNSYNTQSSMDKKINDVKQKIKETRNFWSHLPYQYCNNITTAAPSDDTTCWNGSTLASYNSTPVPSPLNQPPLLSEQIYNLQVLLYKLKAAYQGQDEELPDEDDDDPVTASGSGSGSDELITDDIELEVNESTTTSTTTTTTENIAIHTNEIDNDNEPKVMTASAGELTKALAHYVLPIVMVWFGSGVAELL